MLSCNVAIDACQKCSRWAETLQLLGNFVDELSFKVAMAACEKMARWQQLLTLLTEMRTSRMAANAWTYEMAANLCESPLPLPQLLEELEELAQGGMSHG